MKKQSFISTAVLKIVAIALVSFFCLPFLIVYGDSGSIGYDIAQENSDTECRETDTDIAEDNSKTELMENTYIPSDITFPIGISSQTDLLTPKREYSSLPMEPTEIAITPSRFVPRIGSEIAFQINNFGFENINTGIGSDYKIEVYDYESEKNQAQRFKKIIVPEVQIEQLVNGEWINNGVNIASRIMTPKAYTGTRKDASYAAGEKQNFEVDRESIVSVLEKYDLKWDSISLHNIFLNLRKENGTTNYTQAHRLAHSGTLDFVYDIIDAPANSTYITLQGISEWYKDNTATRDSKAYPKNWLYYETSDISIELIQPKSVYKPNDIVALNVRIHNTSRHLANRRLVAGLDFGQKEIEINPAYTTGEPDLFFEIPRELGIGNLITITIPAGKTIEFITEIVLPDNFENYMSSNGNELTLTPFLFTSNIYSDDDGQKEYQHFEEREYNQVITLPIKQEAEHFTVSFDSNGGSEVEPQILISGENAIPPSDPVREGYTFEDWYFSDIVYDFITPVITNITLQARWIKYPDENGIIDSNGPNGSGESDISQPANDSTDNDSSKDFIPQPKLTVLKDNDVPLSTTPQTGANNTIPVVIVSFLLIAAAIIILLSGKRTS